MAYSTSAESKCTECIIFIVVMHVTFQNYLSRLGWKVLLQYFNGVSAIYMENNSTISPQVVYSCFQSNTFVRKLTLLHFAHFYVLIVMHIKYNKVIDKQAYRLGCKKTFINNQF